MTYIILMEFDRDDFSDIFGELLIDYPGFDCRHSCIPIDGYYTCKECGCVDTTRNVFIERCPSFYRKYIHVYKRRSYFIERIHLMIGRKQSSSPEYIRMLNYFKEHKFKSIHELRRLVKKNKFGKMLKYVYTLYYDLMGKRLINLSD